MRAPHLGFACSSGTVYASCPEFTKTSPASGVESARSYLAAACLIKRRPSKAGMISMNLTFYTPPFVFTAQALTLLCSVHDVRDPAIERDGKEHQEREGRGSHDGEHEPKGNHEDAVRERTPRPFSVPAARALGGLRNALARTRGRLRRLRSRLARLRRSRGCLGQGHACGVRAASISSASQSHQASMPCPRVALTSNRGAVGLRSSSVEP